MRNNGFTPGRIDIISMGCSKNLVDSERLARRLEAKGYDMYADAPDVNGEYVVVNTCGFIGDAKEESIEMILGLAEARAEGRIGCLFVMGCLSQRYMEELKAEIPEVDRWFGKFDWEGITALLPDRTAENKAPHQWERRLTTPPWSAYLKISEGCNRFCAFCAIPLITGRHTSRPIEEIVEEVKDLASRGVRELNVIAQDLSSYGTDLYGESRLAELVNRISEVDGIEWIRLHYAYPSDFPWDITAVMRENPKVCRYLDVALQHASDPVLSNMRRHIDHRGTLDFISRLRREVPGIKIRTTLMVGFPGEDANAFAELENFVREQRFDRMGAFAYCEEEDTFAAKNLKDDIPEKEKQRRLDRIMELQREISESLNESMTGSRVRVLVERREGDYFVGRTEWDSPEVDPEIYLTDPEGVAPEPGTFIMATVTSAEDYDLYGEINK